MNQSTKQNANVLRKNMTKEEKHLWYDFLRYRPEKWYKQRAMGCYIADFYCASKKLVVELDGSQHYESDGVEYDRKRTEYFNSKGIRVVRILNGDVNRNFGGVCEYLEGVMRE